MYITDIVKSYRVSMYFEYLTAGKKIDLNRQYSFIYFIIIGMLCMYMSRV